MNNRLNVAQICYLFQTSSLTCSTESTDEVNWFELICRTSEDENSDVRLPGVCRIICYVTLLDRKKLICVNVNNVLTDRYEMISHPLCYLCVLTALASVSEKLTQIFFCNFLALQSPLAKSTFHVFCLLQLSPAEVISVTTQGDANNAAFERNPHPTQFSIDRSPCAASDNRLFLRTYQFHKHHWHIADAATCAPAAVRAARATVRLLSGLLLNAEPRDAAGERP